MESQSSKWEGDDTSNKTLYDLYKDSLKDSRKAELLHELVLIGKLGNISAEDAKALHKSQIEDVQNEVTDKSLLPTGILFFYPTVFLHVLEIYYCCVVAWPAGLNYFYCLDVFFCFIQKKTSGQQNHIFKMWNCEILKDVPQKPSAPHEATVVQQVSELLDQIIKLAIHLRDIPVIQLETAIQSLAQTGSDIMPRENKINDLLREPSMLTVEGYVERYINIKPITMSEELVWPAPDKLLV